MLRKFRRGSKDIPDSRTGSLVPSDAPADETSPGLSHATTTSSPAPLSFFDLPAEIRNTIYEAVIADATLKLPSSLLATSRKLRLPTKRRNSNQPVPINGLLLASRRCRQEYLSMLFSCGAIVVEVKDFDFDGLIRVASNLDDTEVRALQSNRNLTVLLVTQNCRPKDSMALRKWLDHRCTCEKSLPWKYEFAMETLLPPTRMGRFRLLRELQYYADTISTLRTDMDERQQEELQAVIDAFRRGVEWLQQDLGDSATENRDFSRQLRGLPGGGVH